MLQGNVIGAERRDSGFRDCSMLEDFQVVLESWAGNGEEEPRSGTEWPSG